MGGRNPVYLSQGWTGADGKQIVRRTARVMRSVGPALFAGYLWVCGGVLPSSGSLWSCHVPVWRI
jgi:hypothetical protein